MIEYLVPRASSYASHIDWLFTLILVTVGFWFLVAQAVFFYFLFRYRRRDGVPAGYVTGTRKAEKHWIEWPHFAVILCDVVLIAATVYVWIEVKQDMPTADATVRIVAQQWAWTFVHPGPDGKLGTDDDITTVDELHLQVGSVYHFELSSKDVIHSFSVPVFRLKQDAVPGRTITGWFKPTLTGRFDVQCAEICGIGHALMPARLSVESKEEHEAWMRQARS
jgi:cytochrome c oxidase subunit 2